jgi:hypothetical protein
MSQKALNCIGNSCLPLVHNPDKQGKLALKFCSLAPSVSKAPIDVQLKPLNQHRNSPTQQPVQRQIILWSTECLACVKH